MAMKTPGHGVLLTLVLFLGEWENAVSQDTVVALATNATSPTTRPPTPPSRRDPLDTIDRYLEPYLSNDVYVESPTFDGWYNNRDHLDYGAADTPLDRILPPRYKDGVYQTATSVANPLDISDKVMAGDLWIRSRGNRTSFFVYFGKHVLREIVDTSEPACPFEYDVVEVPANHEYRRQTGKAWWRVPRDKCDPQSGMAPHNPRAQVNGVTAWIDGSAIYGSSKYWSNRLRSFEGGHLQSSQNGSYPAMNRDPELPMSNPPPPAFHKVRPPSSLWKFGARDANENPFLSSIGVLWFRWHNYLADRLRKSNETDQKIFEQARKWVVATYQHFVMDFWLPAFIGEPTPPYKGYSPGLNPAISQLFLFGATTFLDSLATPALFPRYSSGSCGHIDFRNSNWPRGIRLCNAFWRSREVLEEFGLDSIVEALANQPAEREDHILVEDLERKYYGSLDFSRQSKGALNIQKGRDHGVPTYYTVYRRYFPDQENGAVEFRWEEARTLWSEVDRLDPSLLKEVLPELYRSPRDVDFSVGILLETRVSTGKPGVLLAAIVKEQLLRLRDADRFWYENSENGLFTQDQIDFIKKLKLSDIIRATTCLDIGDDPFFLLPGRSGPHSGNALDAGDLESCTRGETYDYFEGSEASFILLYLFLFAFIIGCVAVLFYLVKRKKVKVAQDMKKLRRKKSEAVGEGAIVALEWQGNRQPKRKVLVRFDESSWTIHVQEAVHTANGIQPGQIIRSLDLRHLKRVELQVGTTDPYFLIRTPNEYDLVLVFADDEERDDFISSLHDFLGKLGVGNERREVPVKVMLKEAISKRDRQAELEKFFRMVFAQAFDVELVTAQVARLSPEEANKLVHTELTRFQFAECLSLEPSSAFVENMFQLADKDGNGYINFREFLDILIIFSKGNADDKAKLMFDMYDINRSGHLSRVEFTEMIKSLLELSNQTLTPEQINNLVSTLFESAGIKDDNAAITFSDFKSIVAGHKEELGYAHLEFQSMKPSKNPPPDSLRNSIHFKAQQVVSSSFGGSGSAPRRLIKEGASSNYVHVRAETKKSYESDRSKSFSIKVFHLLENYQLHIVWLALVTLALWGVFIQRAYYYSVDREDSGLRRLAGYGVTISRGSASAIMLAFSLLLLTMCRNLITLLRETFLHRFIPFDASVPGHKYIALWALFFSILHIVGHAFNFYHLSTQPTEVIHCMFPDYYHGSDGLPKFHFWAFGTITGLTGIFLVLVLTVMYVFAVQYARRHVFNAFWQTHSLFPLVYGLTVLHGLGNLLQSPSFYLFLAGPGLLFIADRLISLSRKQIEIPVIKAHMLPSDVTNLVFKRPPNFEYRSGQWVRIACKALNSHEYHPFTLSSAPHEENLSLHIRAAGPWTINLRKIYHPDSIQEHSYPKIYLDGPFGGGHQDWFRYEVSVLVGGGIGVTPFASILKDIAFRASLPQAMSPHFCKKVYFIWVTRTQRQFEWLIDIIRNVEEKDGQALVETHIFITQFYQKFDLRTIMLYICERHFQKVSNRSLFTGLSATTHFGRPNFFTFFDSLQMEYPDVKKVGVFSCGPPPMTLSVDESCQRVNRQGGALFVHHYENF